MTHLGGEASPESNVPTPFMISFFVISTENGENSAKDKSTVCFPALFSAVYHPDLTYFHKSDLRDYVCLQCIYSQIHCLLLG